MNKIGAVAIVVAMVTAAYLLLLVTMPVLVDFASTANTTMHAETANMSAYPGAAEGVLMAPWALFFVPGAIGIIVIVIILKKP